MKRIVFLLVATALGALALSGVALALPSDTPDNTPAVSGPVRGISQVGNNVWVVGNFDRVVRRDDSVVDNVRNAAVFDSATRRYEAGVAPELGGPTAVVRDIAPYGGNLLIAGSFGGPSAAQKNLVLVDGTTGEVIRWFNSPALQSVLAVPQLGRVYGGGRSLSAFQIDGPRLWTRAKTTVDPDLRSHATEAGYRDLELDGPTIWAACACDAVDGSPSKAMVKLNTEGDYDASWRTEAGTSAFGISLAQSGGTLYLGAGGSDFLARYEKNGGGDRGWTRDTSGSTQVVEIMDNRLVVGGHFWEVADEGGDRCGSRSSDNDVTLDPNDECQTRHGLAAYSFSGSLDANWDPQFAGRYALVWALHPDTVRTGVLHFGGEFTTVNGIRQTHYGRFLPQTTTAR